MKRRQDLILKRLHALTLIELVVVCAIIVVLVGIVWVVMAPAREKARQVVCLSNLTQIGHAFRMYRDDWDGVEPQKGVQLEYWQLGLPPETPPVWTLEPYTKNYSVWRCPSDWVTLPTAINTYLPNYCTHEDAAMHNLEYDKCWLLGVGVKSFKEMIAKVPDWPVLYCEAHHQFIYPNDWEDKFYFGVSLPDFAVRRFHRSDIVLKLYGGHK